MKKARNRLVEKEKDEAIAGKGLGARKKNGFRGIERSRATLSGGKCSPVEPCQGIIDTPLTINVLDVGRDGQLVIGPR